MHINRLLFVGIIFLALLSSCREEIKITDYSTDMENEYSPEGYNDLLLARSIYLQAGDLGLVIEFDGRIFQPYSRSTNGWSGRLENSGLWIGAIRNGNIECSIVHEGMSNFTTMWSDTIMMGVFGITENSVQNPYINWPYEYGAPVNDYGRPKLYGSKMTWSSFTSKSLDWSPVFDTPVQDLRINQSVFVHDREDLNKAVFIRYDIKNLGADLSDIYSSYWSNVDISINDFENDLIGYDEISDISYTYRAEPDSVTGQYYIFGITYLKTPFENTNEIGVSSHRILLKGNDPQYGDVNLNSEQVLNAMKGLTNMGNPMINPTTGGATRFAFNGHPEIYSGWLDQPRDARSILSIGPFSLANEETKSFIILMVVEESYSLSDALFRLKYRIGQIRQETNLWNQ